jgi:threonine synthase
VSALSLSCRVCATEHPLEAVGSCSRCFGPLDPVYDWDHVRASLTREGLEERRRDIWRYAELLPVSAPDEPRLAPGFTPLVPAPRLADAVGVRELWL